MTTTTLRPDPTRGHLALTPRPCVDTACFRARFAYWLLGLLTERANYCGHDAAPTSDNPTGHNRRRGGAS